MTSYSVRNQPVVGQSELGTPATSPVQASTSRKRGKLSEILTNVSGGGEGELVSVALKSLPVDPERWQTGGGSGAGPGTGAETCKEAVEAMVVGVKGACEEAGVVDDGDEGFITEEDIVRCVVYYSIVAGVPRSARSEVGWADHLPVGRALAWQKRSDRDRKSVV